MRILFILTVLLCTSQAWGQYDPAGGELGSLAVHKNSSVITSWASKASVKRGWVDISDTSQGKVVLGNPADVYAKADRFVMSLGDAGEVTLEFEKALINHAGFDFAVFENGFVFGEGYFLELAFVEVSTNGKKFHRFPAISLVDTTVQKDNGSTLDPTLLYNFAGKHQSDYGTPFDLEELKDSLGDGVDSVRFIRLIDVVGNLSDSFARYDSRGNKINDPWPTPFNSGGFDLDAVAILGGFASVNELKSKNRIYPNPARSSDVLRTDFTYNNYQIYDERGSLIDQGNESPNGINLSGLTPGIYTIKMESNGTICTKRLTVY